MTHNLHQRVTAARRMVVVPKHFFLVTADERILLLTGWHERCAKNALNPQSDWVMAIGPVGAQGSLLFEEGEFPKPSFVESQRALARAAVAGTELPPGFFVWNTPQWTRAYDLGVRMWGERWLDDPQTGSSDLLMQLTLLGEKKY